jgi:hypothetical protein
MGKKSDPPPAPDYTQAAEKTAQSSQQAQTRADWSNRPTQNTPWGQSSWNASAGVDPSTGQPITNWEQNITLDPAQQQALDSQMAVQQGRSDIAQGMMGRLSDATQQPFNWNNMSPMGQAPQGGNWGGVPQAGQQMGGNVRDFSGGAGGVGAQAGGANEGIQRSLDPNLYGDQGRQRIENAMFDRMRPQHEQQAAGLEGKLANMGLSRGSEAWNREMQNMGDQQSRERFNALDRGLQEQQGQFGMAQGAGQFANQAQNQGFGQNLSNAQLGLQGQMANAQNALGFAGLGQQGDIARSQLNMQGQNQNFQQQMQGQGLYGQQLNQNFQQGMQGADYQNRLRQQQIAEQVQQRNMPLNELNALLSGQQVGNPQMPNFNPSQSAGGANYNMAAQNQYGGAMDAYNAQQARQQGMMSGLSSLGSMGMMAFSDERLKRNIVKRGELPSGIGVYEYDIFDRHEVGVLAQEVQAIRPDLVHMHDSGYLMVNYGGLQ